MSSDVDVNYSGPWFDGRADRAVDDYLRYAGKTVADEGVKRVKANLHAVIRHPTGFYEGHIQDHQAGETWHVDDGGVIYGPWLEGVGSRNSPRTRFPGYSTFRRTRQELDHDAARLVDPIPSRFMEAMNR